MRRAAADNPRGAATESAFICQCSRRPRLRVEKERIFKVNFVGAADAILSPRLAAVSRLSDKAIPACDLGGRRAQCGDPSDASHWRSTDVLRYPCLAAVGCMQDETIRLQPLSRLDGWNSKKVTAA